MSDPRRALRDIEQWAAGDTNPAMQWVYERAHRALAALDATEPTETLAPIRGTEGLCKWRLWSLGREYECDLPAEHDGDHECRGEPWPDEPVFVRRPVPAATPRPEAYPGWVLLAKRHADRDQFILLCAAAAQGGTTEDYGAAWDEAHGVTPAAEPTEDLVEVRRTGRRIPHPPTCGGCRGAGCPEVELVERGHGGGTADKEPER